MTDVTWHLRCLNCDAAYDGLEIRYRCRCGGTLDVIHDWSRLPAKTALLEHFRQRLLSRDPVDRSGVWRFRELVLPLAPAGIVTKPEGNTNLYASPPLSEYTGVRRLLLKHEGENPSGSFKDRGMTVAISLARRLGMNGVACASTGNTSASMASYAAIAAMEALVFIPEGKVALGKLSQSIAYGARTIQIEGSFDDAMDLVERVCALKAIYLVNSLNPFRLEGQKTIAFELLEDLAWDPPDWIVLPGGNLGNSSAIYKGLSELKQLGWIDRLPRLAVVQAEGANPLYRAYRDGGPLEPIANPETIATAIRIGSPVSWRKCLRGVTATGGVVEQVSDDEIMDAHAAVARAGIGAEPASCATVAGVAKLVASGVVSPDERVCGVLTGHLLKDPDAVIGYHSGTLEKVVSRRANPVERVPADLQNLLDAVGRGRG